MPSNNDSTKNIPATDTSTNTLHIPDVIGIQPRNEYNHGQTAGLATNLFGKTKSDIIVTDSFEEGENRSTGEWMNIIVDPKNRDTQKEQDLWEDLRKTVRNHFKGTSMTELPIRVDQVVLTDGTHGTLFRRTPGLSQTEYTALCNAIVNEFNNDTTRLRKDLMFGINQMR